MGTNACTLFLLFVSFEINGKLQFCLSFLLNGCNIVVDKGIIKQGLIIDLLFNRMLQHFSLKIILSSTANIIIIINLHKSQKSICIY